MKRFPFHFVLAVLGLGLGALQLMLDRGQQKDWFSSRAHEVDEIKSTLLNKTRVIWFELAAQDNAVDAFTRLNVGKIPLTDDELIRALFLKRGDASETDIVVQQLKISHEWDQLEKALQADDFWYFLSNQQGRPQNRIGLLLELVAKTDGLGEGALFERHADYGYILENGRVVMDGTAADLRSNEDVKEFYLGLSSTGRKSYRDVKHYRRRKRWLA